MAISPGYKSNKIHDWIGGFLPQFQILSSKVVVAAPTPTPPALAPPNVAPPNDVVGVATNDTVTADVATILQHLLLSLLFVPTSNVQHLLLSLMLHLLLLLQHLLLSK
jgi:hypothetical protein